MSIDLDDEILQDFLVEAGEILELLGEQLVQLEQTPNDVDLLNAIFRGFHTIKGGAGFLSIEPMVDTCHVSEDIFNVLRQGARQVSPELMDAVLQALDVINVMFSDIQSGKEPEPADPDLLQRLRVFAVPGGEEPAAAAPEPEPVAEPEPEAPAENLGDGIDLFDAGSEEMPAETVSSATDSSSEDITDDEFEELLDQLHGKGKHGGNPVVAEEETPAAQEPAKATASDGGELITDDEFEDLLDQLHGKGIPGQAAEAGKEEPAPVVASSAEAAGGDELITEDEFESLLDQMHGKGKGPSSSDKSDTPAAPAPAPKPAPAPPPKAAAAPEPAAAKPVAASAPKPAAPPAKATAGARGETTVRVDTERLDDIMNLVGELVLVRNRLDKLKEDLGMGDNELSKAISNLDIVTSDLQTSVMKTRMQPIKKVFGRFPRVIRDLARSLNKDIALEMIGEETDLDKNLVEALADPLVHLVRNSVDHGVEMPDVREAAGKPRQGTVTLAAEQEGDHILLSIEDDGAGMDPEHLRKLAVKKGLMDKETASRLEDKECFNLIFMPGFSTKEQISDISGRGVGMDVVKTRITQLNGQLDIDSELGKGTKLNIKVPLTLAILPTLMVRIGKHAFALPLSMVREIIELETKTPNIIDGQPVIMVREKAVPLFYLSNWLLPHGETAEKGEGEGQVIIIRMGNQTVGIVVDMVIGQEEVVIKPLGAFLKSSLGFAGSTITGDGGIALILDIANLFKHRSVKGF